MPQKNYLFYCLSLMVLTNCQLSEVHLDCPTGDCSTENSSVIIAKESTPFRYYRLKTLFRGAGESLDDGQSFIRLSKGGIFMNLNEDSPHQLWRLDTLDNGYVRLKSKASGEDKSLEANGIGSPLYGGASFMNNQQNMISQYWYLEPRGDDYYRLRSPLYNNRCLEGNRIKGDNLEGAAFMNECSGAIGQLWKLEKAE